MLPSERDVILGHALNEGWLHLAPLSCRTELCEVAPEICVVAELFDFLIVCLTDTVAPVALNKFTLGTGIINEHHKVYQACQRDVLMIHSSDF